MHDTQKQGITHAHVIAKTYVTHLKLCIFFKGCKLNGLAQAFLDSTYLCKYTMKGSEQIRVTKIESIKYGYINYLMRPIVERLYKAISED